MQKIWIALTIAVLTAGPSVASEETDVMVPVHQFVDGFNKGDTKSALAAYAEQTSIVDEFPPYEWHGMGACSIGRRTMKPMRRRMASPMGSISQETTLTSSFPPITPSRKMAKE
jgi:hypothetical protein